MQSAVGSGIGLLLFGLFVAVGTGLAYNACQSPPQPPSGYPPPPTPPTNCSGLLAGVGFGVLLLVIGALLLAYGFFAAGRTTYVRPSVDPAVPPPIIPTLVVQASSTPGLPSVRCRYCGSVVDPSARRCPSCGAPI